MAVDKNENTQLLITFPNDLLEKIEDYRFENRVENRSEAIRDLIRKGLESD